MRIGNSGAAIESPAIATPTLTRVAASVGAGVKFSQLTASLPTLPEMLADEAAVDRAIEQVRQEAKRRGVRPACVLLFELAAMRSQIEAEQCGAGMVQR